MKLLFACLCTLSLLPLWGQPTVLPSQKEGEWILMTAPESGRPAIDPAILVRPLSAEAGAYLLRFPEAQEAVLSLQMSKLPGFIALQPNYYLSARSIEPNDPYFGSQWTLARIQAPETWEFTTGGSTALGDPIVVAVMDDGFDLEHPDLVDNLWVNEIEQQGIPGLDDDENGYVDDVRVGILIRKRTICP
ncbi:MAG: hypothetical protein IPJ40_06425 [Saprospirales bacterium]|nr:hypothetical protein [Saprospirales bacterium]